MARNIFEDVGGTRKRGKAARPDIEAQKAGQRRAVGLWLGLLFVLVAAMVAVGGLTRLTDSGLSITNWDLFSGTLPPMNDADWQFAFDLYRASPEFAGQNAEMDLAGFKVIFWWEWTHRLLGRVVGLVWAAGFVWFVTRRTLPPGWTGRLLLVGALGGLQGVAGWWMVSSGLKAGMVDVASTRLAVHLGLAFLILGLISWFILRLRRSEAQLLQARRQRQHGLARLLLALLGLVMLQVVAGALVAGIDAGRNFPTWPLMAGEFVPGDSMVLQPWWRNFFENAGLVQFNHRMLAYGVAALALFCWWVGRVSPLSGLRRRLGWLALAVLGQVLLGIATVLQAAALPLALAHQLGAMLLLAAVLAALFEALYPRPESLRK